MLQEIPLVGVVISGPSGAGKSRICEKLRQSHDPEFKTCISVTTRALRPGEVDGKDYYVRTDTEFMAMISGRKFLEFEKYGDAWYGTLASEVLDVPAGVLAFLDVDVRGHSRLRQSPELEGRLLSFFIDAPDQVTLEARLRGRALIDGMPEEKILERLERGLEERGFANQYDHLIINRVVDDAAAEIFEKIRSRLLVTA